MLNNLENFLFFCVFHFFCILWNQTWKCTLITYTAIEIKLRTAKQIIKKEKKKKDHRKKFTLRISSEKKVTVIWFLLKVKIISEGGIDEWSVKICQVNITEWPTIVL